MSRPVAITIFCEDVRAEVAGTATVVGVMPDQLAVPSFPTVLPKLCAYTRVVVPIDTPVVSLSTVLYFGEEEGARVEFETELLTSSQEAARAKGAPVIGFIGTIVSAPFMVVASMKVRAVTSVNGEELLSGYLNLILQDSTA